MQTTLIPNVNLQRLSSTATRSFWGRGGGGNNSQEMSLVSLEEVCQPKEIRGLNFRRLIDCNKAFLMKLAQQIYFINNALWIQVVKDKYMKNNNFRKVSKVTGSTHIWEGIYNAQPTMLMQVNQSIGIGDKAQFWLDNYVANRLLIELATTLIIEQDLNLTINNFTSKSGTWIWENFVDKLPYSILLLIAGMNTPCYDLGRESSCLFLVKSANKSLRSDEGQHTSEIWQKIWKIQTPQRVRTFMWLVMKNTLMANCRRFERHLATSTDWELCVGMVEDWYHVLRDCPITCSVQSDLSPPSRLLHFKSTNPLGWSLKNINSTDQCMDGTLQRVRFV